MPTPPLVDQPNAMPTNKVLAAGIAGAIVTVAVFVLQQVNPGFAMPEHVVAAATTIVSVACAYVVRNQAVEPSAPPTGPAQPTN